MSEETDKQIRERLSAIFPSEVVASRVVDMVTAKRPDGWGRHSNAPYYKEFFARQTQEQIDKMIASRESGNPVAIIYRWDTFCNEKTGMSRNTLYNRFNQSLNFLLKFLDPMGKYEKWYQTVTVDRTSKVGLTIEFMPEFLGSGSSSFEPEFVIPKAHTSVWRREMEEWLEGESFVPFVKEGLALNPEEIEQIKAQISQLINVKCSITSHAVKIIRLNI